MTTTAADADAEANAANKSTLEQLKKRLLSSELNDGFAEEDDDDNEALTAAMEKASKEHNVNAATAALAGAASPDAAASAGMAAIAATAPLSGKQERVQLYDSKRMSRVSFNSWYEFDSYFEMYMQETFQPFRMRSSCSVEAYRRNQQKVMMNNKNSRGRRIEFPDAAIHHHRIYMCTHAMKARCRGATTRPGQKYRGIGCIAKINVKISPSDNPSKYMVIVTDQVVTHNHPISRDIYESYPDVLLKTMRRNQLNASMIARQPSPKFETASQTQKYERVMGVLNNVAEAMARLSDEEFEIHFGQLQKIYAGSLTDNAQV
ncbi:TPA: hypothetical protein N0F65_006954 [Lagenidium giganteum]|uniref:FAR1 domain-containing protein n=1 Tax=Lagenidium giganteum TaxID=4803 RepID=A0AAV2ZJ69_9STRA|nr:TPA: hypothetical protein N0F65_006954 [Lagenidium giganteum]